MKQDIVQGRQEERCDAERSVSAISNSDGIWGVRFAKRQFGTKPHKSLLSYSNGYSSAITEAIPGASITQILLKNVKAKPITTKGREHVTFYWESRHPFEQFMPIDGHLKIATIDGTKFNEKEWQNAVDALGIIAY
jgi:hypothetical protein